jgi:hypothetical protein
MWVGLNLVHCKNPVRLIGATAVESTGDLCGLAITEPFNYEMNVPIVSRADLKTRSEFPQGQPRRGREWAQDGLKAIGPLQL